MKECLNCSQWKKNMEILNAPFSLNLAAVGQYTGDIFRYCPWCGELLGSVQEPENKEILWDEIEGLLIKAIKIINIDPYDSDNITFNLDHRTGITISWYSFADHPKYGGSNAYYEKCSKGKKNVNTATLAMDRKR